ncbi:hypothetical protein [Spiroplasma endosymbiont of Polydrusus pterygomalis]|uniref:hypothetical protein n=1 Tax=Spiroplasma endosymbiont of Polydrusus pterygomalis TaxID=3139327 RepID=UPI003CCA9C82
MKNKNTTEKIIIKIKKISNNKDKKQTTSDNDSKLIKPKITKLQTAISDFDSVNEIKENLNTMTIYITQLLDLSPFTRNFLIKNEKYQNATFAVRNRKEITEEKYNIISEQVILDYMRNMFQAAYSQASINESWEWFINDLNNVTIVNLTNLFKKHLEECKIKWIADGDDSLAYHMDYPITIKVAIKGKTFNVTSTQNFTYIVRMATLTNSFNANY